MIFPGTNSSKISRQIVPPKSPTKLSCHIFPQNFPLEKGVGLEGAHTIHTRQLPWPHIFLSFSRQDAGKIRMEGRQDVPSSLLRTSSHISPKFT